MLFIPAILTALRLVRPNNCRMAFRVFSLSTSLRFENFMDKEFMRAKRSMDTEEIDDPGHMLQKLQRDQIYRIKAMKRARNARLFRPPREPRTLTWDTIEQIRYLKQESGEEWSIDNLAESFGVSKTTIVKLLKSKFVPMDKSQRRQDEAANVNIGLLSANSSDVAARSDNKSLVSSFSEDRVTPPNRSKMRDRGNNEERIARKPFQRSDTKDRKTIRIPADTHRPYASQEPNDTDHGSNPTQKMNSYGSRSYSRSEQTMTKRVKSRRRVNQSDVRTGIPQENYMSRSLVKPSVNLESVESDDYVDSDYEELDIDMECLESYDDGKVPTKVVQKGREVFDEKGEFMYRL